MSTYWEDRIAELDRQKEELLKQKRAAEIANKPKRKKKGDFPVYYDPEGNLMPYKPWRSAYSNTPIIQCHESTNEPFLATLTFVDKVSKRHDYGSSVKYYLADEDGHTYPMFQTSLYQAIMNGAAVTGKKISGVWQVTKKGNSYGIEWQHE